MTKERKSLYRRFVPKFIRKAINDHEIKNTILSYYENQPKDSITDEESEALSYLKNNKICVFPYAFQHQYKPADILVYNDDKLKLKYILFEGKRLYFKRTSSFRGIRRNYNALLIEQDENSPHRYLTNSFNLNENDILVDVGAAEGNLPLEVIEKVKKVYLFETNEKWIEALEATFAPWKDKVVIVNKFVSDINDANHVSLDEFFKDKEAFTFLKVDAEGAEACILKGANGSLSSNRDMRIALCCYHKPNDATEFDKHLNEMGFSNTFAKGFMIFDEPKTFSPPYLRKGILRGVKNTAKG